MNIYLLVGLIFAILIIVYLVIKLYHINEQISFIRDVLEDIKTVNLNRRVLVQEKDITKQICYDINKLQWIANHNLFVKNNLNRHIKG